MQTEVFGMEEYLELVRMVEKAIDEEEKIAIVIEKGEMLVSFAITPTYIESDDLLRIYSGADEVNIPLVEGIEIENIEFDGYKIVADGVTYYMSSI